MTYIQHYSIIQISFLLPWKLSVFYLFMLPSLPTPGNHWHFQCLHSFVFSRMLHNRNHTVSILFRLVLSLSNMNLRFFHVFCGLIAHFFLVLYNIPLSKSAAVHLSVHLSNKGYLYCFHIFIIINSIISKPLGNYK